MDLLSFVFVPRCTPERSTPTSRSSTSSRSAAATASGERCSRRRWSTQDSAARRTSTSARARTTSPRERSTRARGSRTARADRTGRQCSTTSGTSSSLTLSANPTNGGHIARQGRLHRAGMGDAAEGRDRIRAARLTRRPRLLRFVQRGRRRRKAPLRSAKEEREPARQGTRRGTRDRLRAQNVARGARERNDSGAELGDQHPAAEGARRACGLPGLRPRGRPVLRGGCEGYLPRRYRRYRQVPSLSPVCLSPSPATVLATRTGSARRQRLPYAFVTW